MWAPWLHPPALLFLDGGVLQLHWAWVMRNAYSMLQSLFEGLSPVNQPTGSLAPAQLPSGPWGSSPCFGGAAL